MGRLIALAAALVAAAAVAGAASAAPAQRVAVPFETIERKSGYPTDYRTRRHIVVRSQRRWEAVWPRLHAGTPLPAVDFSTRTVVVVLQGIAPPGSRLRVARVERSASRLLVRARGRFGDGCGRGGPGIANNPYEAISVPRTTLPVSVRYAIRDRGCESAAAQAVPFTTVARESASSDYTARTTLVIRTKQRYRHVWRRLHERIRPRPVRPQQDLRRHTLIAVLRGSGTGIGIEVDQVRRGAEALQVRAIESRPGQGCVVPQVIVQPFHLIRVPRTTGPVRTERVERVRDC